MESFSGNLIGLEMDLRHFFKLHAWNVEIFYKYQYYPSIFQDQPILDWKASNVKEKFM